MTKEEKVMFLMRLAVDTHNAYRSAQITTSQAFTAASNPMKLIGEFYSRYEEFFDEKIKE
ncbi:hypothetical protein RHD99_10800 [Buttiauxella selenatireducens]|uniref:Uncharacterized protein n=1 Tax=Buttiauxella selenatireducens TaxID=3073902 RepID=A0ABY9SHA3_9ENTR|nr:MULTISPECIES: hypothetical protein [unclassified Buttiauxella]WMY76373.1 hypothetical protein RHD99_10800 [Buttiauxella sp. R73]GDX04069.1 hypothetical protein BSPA111_02280 [Buttiauxella sp. A111]